MQKTDEAENVPSEKRILEKMNAKVLTPIFYANPAAW